MFRKQIKKWGYLTLAAACCLAGLSSVSLAQEQCNRSPVLSITPMDDLPSNLYGDESQATQASCQAEAVIRTKGTDRSIEMYHSQDPAPKAAITVEEPQQAQSSKAIGESAAEYLAADQQIGPFEIIDQMEENRINVVSRRSRILRTQFDIRRTSIIDPSVCDVLQFTPREFALVGKKIGSTQITFWFEDGSHRPVTFLIRTLPDPDMHNTLEKEYKEFEALINRHFPNSKVVFTILANKLIIRGQAYDAIEASQIMSVIRSGPTRNNNSINSFSDGPAVSLLGTSNDSSKSSLEIVNMLTIPGVQTVALKVKMASLNRSKARGLGVDLSVSVADGQFFLKSMVDSLMTSSNGGVSANLLNKSGSFGGAYSFSDGGISWGINYLESAGVVRVLSEPTLVTTSGKEATLVAGGEFACPTTVGVGGASAVSTSFRAYGAIVSFLPVVIDKDLIRLDISPEFSSLSAEGSNSQTGTPGLTTRSITTTVEMREGQTLAIGGLIDTSMKGESSGDLPWIGNIIGTRGTTAEETELIVLVSPELVLPLEPEAVPPLPGFDVTEPTNGQFYIHGKLEGTPTQEYRSVVWPNLRNRYTHGGTAIMSGPYGHSGMAK